MTALDRQVAERLGLRIFSADEIMRLTPGGSVWVTETYAPSTNLLQAYQLWEEARPEGWWLETLQCPSGGWSIGRLNDREEANEIAYASFADLPRAITTAWLEAMEGILARKGRGL